MATISIGKKHHLSHAKAKAVAAKIAEDLNERFALEYEWDGDDVHFNRSGIHGRLHVGKDELHIDVKLGLLLTPLKPSIEKEIHAQLDSLIGKPVRRKAS